MLKVSAILLVLQVLLQSFPVQAQVPDVCQNLPEIGVDDVLTEFEMEFLERGYCLLYGSTYFFIPGIPTQEFLDDPGPVFFETRAIWVTNEAMDAQLDHHEIDLSSIGVIDGVGVLPCTLVFNGQIIYIKLTGSSQWDRLIAADCARPYHYEQHGMPEPQTSISTNFGLASSLEITPRYALMRGYDPEEYDGGIYGVLVCVTDQDPYEVCSGEPVRSDVWIMENITHR